MVRFLNVRFLGNATRDNFFRLAKTGKRNEIFLATKFGFVLGDPLPDGRRICGDPEYAKQAIDRSLEKLGVEYVDLWYYHRSAQ